MTHRACTCIFSGSGIPICKHDPVCGFVCVSFNVMLTMWSYISVSFMIKLANRSDSDSDHHLAASVLLKINPLDILANTQSSQSAISPAKN